MRPSSEQSAASRPGPAALPETPDVHGAYPRLGPAQLSPLLADGHLESLERVASLIRRLSHEVVAEETAIERVVAALVVRELVRVVDALRDVR